MATVSQIYKRTAAKAPESTTEQHTSASHAKQGVVRRVGRQCNPLLPIVLVLLAMLSFNHHTQEYSHNISNATEKQVEKATDSLPVNLNIFKDVELGHLLGKGDAVTVFRARVPKLGDSEYAVKISYELFYTAKEVTAFKMLNREPSIPNIPKLFWSAQELLNPYAARDYDEIHDFFRKRGVKTHKIKKLYDEEEISIQILQLVPHTGIPNKSNLDELARFIKSLLEALDFAHARNIMNNDIVLENVLYDNSTGITYLPDWNDMRLFVPHHVGLNPFVDMQVPEAQGVDMPVHATVSAFDIYCCGLMLNKLLCGRKTCTAPPKSSNNEKLRQAHDLVSQMLTKDPHQRPSASDLLKHVFVAE